MRKATFFFVFVLFSNCISAHFKPGTPFTKKKPGDAVRFHFGPMIGFYTINPKHAKNPDPRSSFTFGIKKEWKADREYKTFFSVGLDYLFHGLNFRSYYFLADSIKLYDKNFAYNYGLYIHELHVPLQLKLLFKQANNSVYSPYVIIGFHLRYLLGSNLVVTQNGNRLKTDNPEMSFKNPILNKHMNSFLSLGIGWQKNSLSSSRGNFFMELHFKYGISAYSFQRDYAASSLYINSSHLGFILGFKF